MNSGLTIAVVTKNRPAKLRRCLESISKQTILPEKVFVIDNDRRKSAAPVLKKIKKLNTQYFLVKRLGVPYARNKALEKSSTTYLGFVDDDCVLDRRWVEVATKVLSKKNEFTYVVGHTKLYNKNNLSALAQHCRDNYWKLKMLKRGNETTRYHFDTKNVVIRKKPIESNNIKFDTRCSIREFDSGDFDFGLNLASKSLKGLYLKKMILFHEENSSLVRFIRRAYYRGKIAGYINKKWNLGHKLINLSARNFKWWIFDTINNFSKEKEMYTKSIYKSGLKKTLITILIRVHDRAFIQGYA